MRAQRSVLIVFICLVFGLTATVLVAQQAQDDTSARQAGAGANLVLTSLSGSATAILNQTISMTITVKNMGDAASGAFNVGLYLSANKKIDPATDCLLGSVTFSTGLAPGEIKRKTTKVLVPSNASAGRYYYGAVVASSKKASSKQVAVIRYTLGDNNETVTDHKTDMIWQRADDATSRNWGAANQYCQDLDLASYDDWRLPTVEELFPLADRSRFDPAADQAFESRSGGYWSSSNSANNSDEAWFVDFQYGDALRDPKVQEYYVRCMRSEAGSAAICSVPGAPTGVSATAGNAQATVSFSAPVTTGGSLITSYTVTSSPEGKTITGASSPLTVTGLTNGNAYTFKIRAANSVGSGPWSTPSNSVTPIGSATLPGAPTGVAAIAGDAQAIVTFMAPASNGGSPITSYTVTSTPGAITATGSSSPITVTGLTNGITYTFTVRATNSLGTGPASSPSSSIVLPTLPGAPTGVSATAGNAQATVSFSASSDGGSLITSYTVTSNDYKTTTGASSPITMTGLTNGTAYTFTVTATNAVGTGPASNPSNTVIPATIPGAPTGVTATAGTAQATVSFTPPSIGGGPTTYTVTSSPGGIVATGASSPITITGLYNGTPYTFTVKATNAFGTGPASSPSNSVIPATIPGAPTGVTAAAGVNTQATIIFTAPASDGGSSITTYTVTSSPGGIVATGASSPITVTGLANWTPYTFTVKATNAFGTGPASSPSNSVTLATTFFSVSGRVTSSTTGIPVTMIFSQIIGSIAVPIAVTTTTDSNGNWSQSRFADGATYRVTPSNKSGYGGFTPQYMDFIASRSDLAFTPRYMPVGDGDGTVMDSKTALIWQKDDDGVRRSFSAANRYCADLVLGGQYDWRLPTEGELLGIVDRSRRPSIDPVFHCQSDGYWINLSYLSCTHYVNFENGDEGIDCKDRLELYVRCVRGGP